MKIELSWTILNDTERNWEYPFRCRLRIINVDRWISWTSRKETFGGRSQVCHNRHNEAFSSHYFQWVYEILGFPDCTPPNSPNYSWNEYHHISSTIVPIVWENSLQGVVEPSVGLPREEDTSCHRVLHHQLLLLQIEFDENAKTQQTTADNTNPNNMLDDLILF